MTEEEKRQYALGVAKTLAWIAVVTLVLIIVIVVFSS